MKANAKRLFAALCGVIMLCSNSMGVLAHEEEIVVREVNEYHEPAGDNVAHGIYDIGVSVGQRAATLANCSIGVSVEPSGVIGSIKTGSTVMASEIGIKNITVDKYVNGAWTTVASHPGGSKKNDNAYVVEVTTSSAQKGVEYRITCTHYAVLNGVTHELYNETDGVKY